MAPVPPVISPEIHSHEIVQFYQPTAAFAASTALLRSQQPPSEAAHAVGQPVRRSVVAVSNGASRRNNICAAMLKTHNTVVATLSLKNMALGAPLHSARKESRRWNDKRVYHGGVRQTHVDIALTAQRLQPFWGATVLDGWEGMEGNGPTDGSLVPSRVAIASTDYVAADRVGLEVMGINPEWVGYLGFCASANLGQINLPNIDIRGAKLTEVTRKYQMHRDLERELRWMGSLKEVPEKLG